MGDRSEDDKGLRGVCKSCQNGCKYGCSTLSDKLIWVWGPG